MYQGNKVYIFDHHSRNDNGLVSQDGTAVLLKFDSLSKAMDYMKYFFLQQFDHSNFVSYLHAIAIKYISELSVNNVRSQSLKGQSGIFSQ